MTQEEILKQGRPIEPNCFETDREEQWYKLGLYEGATVSPWHSVSDGDLPTETKGDYANMPFIVVFKDGTRCSAYYALKEDEDNAYFYDDCDCALDVEYWMEIPKLL